MAELELLERQGFERAPLELARAAEAPGQIVRDADNDVHTMKYTPGALCRKDIAHIYPPGPPSGVAGASSISRMWEAT